MSLSGQPISSFVKPVSSSAHLMDSSGNRMSLSGHPINPSGQPISSSAHPMDLSDDHMSLSGHPMSPFGQPISSSAHLMDSSGDRVSSSGHPMSPFRQPMSLSGHRMDSSGDRMSLSGHPISLLREAISRVPGPGAPTSHTQVGRRDADTTCRDAPWGVSGSGRTAGLPRDPAARPGWRRDLAAPETSHGASHPYIGRSGFGDRHGIQQKQGSACSREGRGMLSLGALPQRGWHLAAAPRRPLGRQVSVKHQLESVQWVRLKRGMRRDATEPSKSAPGGRLAWKAL